MTDTSGGFRAARGCSPVPPDAELPAAIIRRLRDSIGEDVLTMTTDAGDAGMTYLELADLVTEQSRRLAAYQAVTGVLLQQGLCFVNQGGYVECLMCGAVKHGEAIRHMPDCAAEALRALVAGEGES